MMVCSEYQENPEKGSGDEGRWERSVRIKVKEAEITEIWCIDFVSDSS
jgi:hypothetical protein